MRQLDATFAIRGTQETEVVPSDRPFSSMSQQTSAHPASMPRRRFGPGWPDLWHCAPSRSLSAIDDVQFDYKATPRSVMESHQHLNNHHRTTLRKIFEHPTSHNIEWHDVISLLNHVGDVEERHDGKYAVTLGEETQVFTKSKSNDIDTQMTVDLRRMLAGAGFNEKSGNS
jgi:hypothetical protein